MQCMQVSFGVHEEEESAARQYDRALLIEKGRAAKTNFPLPDYEKESKEFEEFVVERYSWHALHANRVLKHASIWQHAGIMWTLLQLSCNLCQCCPQDLLEVPFMPLIYNVCLGTLRLSLVGCISAALQ